MSMVNVLLDIEILSRRVSVGVWKEAVPPGVFWPISAFSHARSGPPFSRGKWLGL
jgi:hypothetical protein